MLSEKKEPEFKFELGSLAKDIITGYKGIIIYRTQWINNCNVYGIKCQELKDGKPIDSHQFDEPQIELITEKVVSSIRNTGGPCDTQLEINRI